MRLWIWLLIACISISVAVAVPDYNLKGDSKMIYNEATKEFTISDAITESNYIQFYKAETGLLVDTYISELNTYYNDSDDSYYILEEPMADDLIIFVNQQNDSIKWGYNITLDVQEEKESKKLKLKSVCTSDIAVWSIYNKNDINKTFLWSVGNLTGEENVSAGGYTFIETNETGTMHIFSDGKETDKKETSNDICKKKNFSRHRTKEEITPKYGFRISINSNKKIEKVNDSLFTFDLYFDYSDIIDEGFLVNESYNDTSLRLDLYKYTNLSYVNIDPFLGESTPNSPPIIRGGSGSGYTSRQPNTEPAPPEQLSRSWMDCKEWEQWDIKEEKCFVKAAVPEQKPPYWMILVILAIVYRKRIMRAL